MKRLSTPWPASTRAMTRRSVLSFRGVAQIAVAADALPHRPSGPRHPRRSQADLAQQHLVAGQAEDVADPIALAPRHGLGPAVMAVAARRFDRPGRRRYDRYPGAAPATFGPSGVLARPQDGGDRLAARRLVDVDRHEAAAVVVRVEQRELLPAVGPVLGVVDVEHDAPGHLFEAVAEQLDHRRHHALERDRAGQVLQPADGRLRTQVCPRLGQAADRHLEGRVGT